MIMAILKKERLETMEYNKSNFFNNISKTIEQIRDNANSKISETKKEYYLNYVNKYVKRKLTKAKFFSLIESGRYTAIDDIMMSPLG